MEKNKIIKSEENQKKKLIYVLIVETAVNFRIFDLSIFF